MSRKPEFALRLFLLKTLPASLANYAYSQIKKAKGLNKKINKPVDKERNSILEFCYVIKDAGSQLFPDWLRANGLDQSRCGLATKRPNREFLLSITMGKYSYEELVEQAEQKILQIDNVYQNSSLTDETNHYAIEKLLVEIRDKFYS